MVKEIERNDDLFRVRGCIFIRLLISILLKVSMGFREIVIIFIWFKIVLKVGMVVINNIYSDSVLSVD